MKIKDIETINETAQYDRGDYYDAHKAGEYGRGLAQNSSHGGGGEGSGRDDILKGQSKNLPSDPFSRTSGEIPRSARPTKDQDPFDNYDELDEVSKQRLGDYLHAAHQDVVDRATSASFQSGQAGDKYNRADATDKDRRREQGMSRAVKRLTK